MSKIVKEIIIMLLICLAIMLLLAIGLYQWIPNRKIIPEIEVYAASEEVKDLLEDDIRERAENNGNPILTYSSSDESIEVTSKDLSDYQSNYNYVPGKSHPFSEITESVKPGNGSDIGSTNPGGTLTQGGSQGSSNTQDTEPSVYSNGNGSK